MPFVARLEVGDSVSGWPSPFGWGDARCLATVLFLRSRGPRPAGFLLTTFCFPLVPLVPFADFILVLSGQESGEWVYTHLV